LTTCLTCTNTQLFDKLDTHRSARLQELAARHLLVCNLTEYRAGYHWVHHTCKRANEAPSDVVKLRIEWFARKGISLDR
jgi:hypothetical protein